MEQRGPEQIWPCLMCLEGCMTFCASECSSEAGGGTTSERKSWGIMLNEVEMASRPEWRIMSGFPLVWTPWGSGRRWGRRSGCCDYESQRRESPCSWAVHPQSSCLPFCCFLPSPLFIILPSRKRNLTFLNHILFIFKIVIKFIELFLRTKLGLLCEIAL